ncbi:hypothetical protein MGYG_07863 [Nannizzia gypsea CBS 118893]|uniref:Nuclear membrane fusion protein Kar5 n=1 Tax=Arthroderma gypseum (strain ATCC MYA-4604 / CBS 118893) TaxID=535722 RepID=E4V4D6_ARTGP|nr:hypothetical protein MGYG_07863 [Nannizzia gypsea CBS 118893]EFR04860.1 hypothetical protein MGYG_07863 [Nannizzia gypsea CBS 118893]
MTYRALKLRVARTFSLFLHLQMLTSTVVSVTGFKLPSFTNRQAPDTLEFSDLHGLSDNGFQMTVDLPRLLHGNPAEQNTLFTEALRLLDSMQHAPSCNQRAAASLITSCQTLSADTSERRHFTHSDLDHVKSLYAARLAICEITGAGAAMPEKCLDAFPSYNDWKPQYKDKTQRFQVTDEEKSIPAVLLEPCLRSLESKPQWWTSYSNSRQNAAVMCHAARFEIEKEELLYRHRVLTEVTSGLNNHLNLTLENSYTQTKQHCEFLQVVDTMRRNLLRDLHRDSDSIHNQFTELLAGAKDMFRIANGEFQGFMETALTETATLAKQMKLSILSAQEVKRVLGEVLIEEVKQNSDLVSAEHMALRANAHLITDIQNSLSEVNQARIGFIVEELNRLHVSMHSLSEIVSSVEQQHSSLDNRIKHFDAAFSDFEQKAAFLRHMMGTQIMNQSRLSTCMVSFSVLMDIVFGAALFISGGFTWPQAIQKPSLITVHEVTPIEITCFILGFVISAVSVITIAVRGFTFKSKLVMASNSETMRLP